MLYGEDGEGVLTPLVKKLLLLGIVVIGVPVLALGLGALLGGKDRQQSRKDKAPSEGASPEPTPAETPKPGPDKAEKPKPGQEKAEEPKPSQEKAEEPKPGQEKTEEPKPGQEKAEEPKPAQEKAEEPKPAQEKAEEPKPAQEKAEEAEESTPLPSLEVPPSLETGPESLEEPLGPQKSLRESILLTLSMLASEHEVDQPEPGEAAPLEDRRHSVRLPVNFAVALRGEAGNETVALDLSLSGIKLRSARPFIIGEEAVLSLPGLEQDSVRATVMWCVGAHTGLKFSETAERLSHSWVVDKMIEAGLTEGHLKQKRRWVRVRTNSAVKLVDARDREHEGTMLDIGVGGALVRCGATLASRDGVRLVLPTSKKKAAIALAATVVGCKGDNYHLQFLPLAKGLQKRLEGHILELLKGEAGG